MKKGPKNFDELNLIGGGLRSSGQKSFALRAWRLGGRISPKIISRKA